MTVNEVISHPSVIILPRATIHACQMGITPNMGYIIDLLMGR